MPPTSGKQRDGTSKKITDDANTVLLNGRDIRKMPLIEVKKSVIHLKNEAESLKASLAGLNLVRSKMNRSKNAIEQISQAAVGTPSLLQLNESIFFDGEISDVSSFRIILGAGYMADMPKSACIDYYNMKTASLAKKSQELVDCLGKTEKVIQIVTEYLKKNEGQKEEK
ncbi:hypothetical protein ACOME3_009476 [Neoechinorhynchus agilis]